ncbi:MAG: VWA domain-containing protein [Desulfococcaceae bacterium]|jgi:Ca-activated chloride channel family protein|nr:VWA domain-containing protein [Desulfococcaceae bacterium]
MKSKKDVLKTGWIISLCLIFACTMDDRKERTAVNAPMPCTMMLSPTAEAVPDAYSGSAVLYRAAAVKDFNTEQYDNIQEKGFKSPRHDPLSTFSIDVDTASYANVRRFLNANRLPPADAVRIEELINYFDYDYPQPEGKEPFSLHMETADCPWKNEHRLLHVGIQGRNIPMDKIPAMNLVFLLDVSGSMNSPDKLPLLKKAFRLLCDELREKDRVAIVVYAGAAGLVLESTPGSKKETILNALEKLAAGGSTAGAQGIVQAYKVAKENFISGGNNRIILATDGDFNVGVSSDGELVRMVEEKREEGIFLTVLGFGTGNIKDSKMEKLADKGNGNYAYIDSLLEAKKVLVKEMGGTLFTIAKDVKIQIEFNPAKIKAYRLIGYENRILNKEDFNDDTKDAGELGAGHSVTALYELIPAGSAESVPGVDDLKYQKTQVQSSAADAAEMLTLKLRYKEPDGSQSRLLVRSLTDRHTSFEKASENLRFSASVAALGMLLRNSEYKGNTTYGKIIGMARKARGKDEEGYRAEFIRMAEQAEMLSR